jgi:DNA polymerase
MKTLHIDIETYSSVDISSAGLYKYVESPDFEVLLIAVATDEDRPTVFDLRMMDEGNAKAAFRERLTDPTIKKVAYNATFERVCLSKWLGVDLPADQWECAMARSAAYGYPLGLQACAKAMGMEGKMAEGKDLIGYFSKPCKPTRTNGMRSRNLPVHAPEKWELFKEYCKRDVEVERAIYEVCPAQSETERRVYLADQRINDRGVLVDGALVAAARAIWSERYNELLRQAIALTGLENPNSAMQFTEWLSEQTGDNIASIRKAEVEDMLKAYHYMPNVVKALKLRQEMGKTSIKKYDAMAECMCTDGRVRGIAQYYGTRTGRWAGRLVQMQNLPQNHLSDLDCARKAVLMGRADIVDMMYGDVADTLSQLIRTSFIAPEGKMLAVCDYSAIEARVIAWLAGEKWRLDVFNSTGKIYEASAAMMYGCDPKEITKTDPRRQRGKVAELALGYGGGVNALKAMGAEKMGLSDTECRDIMTKWRAKSPHIVELWGILENAVKQAIKTGMPVRINKGIVVEAFGSDGESSDTLRIVLPSGRPMYYPKMSIRYTQEGERLTYMGTNQTTRKWEVIETYGGKLTENVVQAIARDCLAEVLVRLEDNPHIRTIFHVHDEVVCEVPEEGAAEVYLKQLQLYFAEERSWTKGLPLKGEGYITKYYLKD